MVYALNAEYPSGVFDTTLDDKVPQSTSITSKRRTNNNLFKELTTGYGVNIGFELTNQYYESQKLGTVGMVIEEIVSNDDTQKYTGDSYINAGFSVTALDINASEVDPNNPNIPLVTTKELMYVSNSGNLKVNGVIIGEDNKNVVATVGPKDPKKEGMDFYEVKSGYRIDLGTTTIGMLTVDANFTIDKLDFVGGLNNGLYTIFINMTTPNTFKLPAKKGEIYVADSSAIFSGTSVIVLTVLVTMIDSHKYYVTIEQFVDE